MASHAAANNDDATVDSELLVEEQRGQRNAVAYYSEDDFHGSTQYDADDDAWKQHVRLFWRIGIISAMVMVGIVVGLFLWLATKK